MARKERVTKVIDGDTFCTDKRKHPVRLANVDAPEKDQRGSAAATRKLRALLSGKEVSIDTVARDKYRRSVAKVKTGSRSVNKAMRDYLKQ
ncbi:thermonuclease family protein [Candidatus Zixiibacteriota bacterium]